MIVVSNSTPLVHLSAMGSLGLLREVFGEIWIPGEVYREVVTRGTGRPGAKEVAESKWIKKKSVQDNLAVAALSLSLGRGESEAIILAVELNADLVILDDRSARLKADAIGLTYTGTVGILLLGDERGLLDFQSSLNDLIDTGFRLNPSERQRILENWKAKRRGSGSGEE